MKRLALLGFAEGLARQRLKSRGGSLRMCFSQDKTLPLPYIFRNRLCRINLRLPIVEQINYCGFF
jgi:hypothetical protein